MNEATIVAETDKMSIRKARELTEFVDPLPEVHTSVVLGVVETHRGVDGAPQGPEKLFVVRDQNGPPWPNAYGTTEEAIVAIETATYGPRTPK